MITEKPDVLKERQGIEVCIGVVGSKGQVFIRYDPGRAGVSKIPFHLSLVAIYHLGASLCFSPLI